MKADNLPIAKIFSSGGDIHYVLPHFQREYTWGKEEWQTLLDDALGVYEEMRPTPDEEGAYGMVEHFLGSIVVIHDGMRAGTVGAFKLVDGQQRLTTISLLLKALAKNLEASHPPLSRKIEKLLLNMDEHGDLYFKILPTVKYGDRESYCALLTGKQPPSNTSKIPGAFGFFDSQVTQKLKDGLDPEKLLQVLINAFQVVFINLDQKESPYRIFESLNAKGKPLTQADLVRNYIAMKLPASHQERVFTTSWGRVEDLLQESRNVSRLPELTAFLRHYLAMNSGVLCEEAHVYARFRDRAEIEFTTSALFEEEIENIARFAIHYDRLLRPERFGDKDIATAVMRLNEMEFSTGYPFLLRVFERFEKAHFVKCEVLAILETLENFMIRRYLAGESSSELKRIFTALWAEIAPLDALKSLAQALAKRNYPSDAKLLRSLETRKLYEGEPNRRRTILILETVNRKLSEGSGGYTVLDASPTIEHIMPQMLSDQWKKEIGIMWEQVHKDFLHTIGNLTIVTGGWNSELSNAAFGAKRLKLANNALILNREYFSQGLIKWGRDEIRERAERLGELIVAAWPSFMPADIIPNSDTNRPNERREAIEFHFEAAELVAQKIKTAFRRLSQSRYESGDGTSRLLGLCSKAYDRPGGMRRFWYGVKPSQRDFLEQGNTSWLAFECESPAKVFLFPFSEFEPLFRKLSETPGMHWHVELFEQKGHTELSLPVTGERLDITKYGITADKADEC